MCASDLFENSETVVLDLPALEYGPLKTPIGQIRALLRAAEKVSATRSGEVRMSSRTKAPVFALANGEKVVLTSRKRANCPEGIDGVLVRGSEGLRWISHRLIDQIEQQAKIEGWPKTIQTWAEQWEGQFFYKAEHPNKDGTVDPGKEGLRPPQLGALYAIGAHWSLFQQPATIVMPTGTGKTETMLAALAAFIRRPVLVVVPSDALRSQTARKFLNFGLLRKLGVLAPTAPNPIIGVVTKVPKTSDALEIFERCNVVIGTMDALSDKAADPILPEIAKRVGVVIIDEAHHVGATRWSHFREIFSGCPILQFTATPFRRDGRLVDGQVIYNYPLRRAQQDGYFKPITFEPIYEPVQSKADVAIADSAVAKLREDLGAGLNHLMMVRCSSIERARVVNEIYKARAPDLNPVLVHSRIAGADDHVEDLKAGRSRIAVCVNMLGEGFDLPELKVAAIHDLHKSLAILLQFTGRFTRSTGASIGNATVIANIAEPNVSQALERLYSEDADWNELLSEMSSEAAQEHAKLVQFLNEAKRLDEDGDNEDVAISHKLLRPTISTLVYRAESFTPKKFYEGLPDGMAPFRVWLHSPSDTLFFVTCTEPSVKWARSKSVRDREWALFVLHFDSYRKLLYLSSTDHASAFGSMATAVGAGKIISGDTVFRAMGRINRLIFQNVGVKKHGRRNLSYASYTGAEVVAALGMAEKSGSVKALLSGIGWENGRQITIGCSAKGRIWSREQGTIPRFIDWCEAMGDKLIDDSIDTSKLIDNILLPTVVTELPDRELLSVEWPVEMLRQAEERVVFQSAGRMASQTTFELAVIGADRATNAIDFKLVEARSGIWGEFRFTLGGENGFSVSQTSGDNVAVTIGKIEGSLEEFFSNYPPLFRFVDLTELDANLHIVPQTPYELVISDDRFESWSWDGVDLTKETMWKDGAIRNDSIQAYAAKHFLEAGFDVVFDDDASGEAADLVCLKTEEDHIRVVLVHCKFSGGATAGERVKDVVAVSSQAVRSARWVGKFVQLCQHLKDRNESLVEFGRPSRFLKGGPSDLTRLVKYYRFRPIRPEILIVQPGLSRIGRTDAQSAVLAAAVTYLKETVNIDVGIICSE